VWAPGVQGTMCYIGTWILPKRRSNFGGHPGDAALFQNISTTCFTVQHYVSAIALYLSPVGALSKQNKKLSYRRGTVWCVLSVVILQITMQQCRKLLIRQVLTKPMVWYWRFSWRQCVINKPTTVELCISPVYRRLALAKFSESTM